MGCQQHQEADQLVHKVIELYKQISSLESLKPSKNVDMLFTQLVNTCLPPTISIDVTKLCAKTQQIRSHLIRLCGQAEGLLESHFSTLLGSFENPLNHLGLFPYYTNYLKLSQLEFNILKQHLDFDINNNNTNSHVINKIAFVGSGPLPLTSIVLASTYLKNTIFHNYDLDPSANLQAFKLVSSDPDLSKRMFFHTTDIMNVTIGLKEFDVVFLAALVGMDKEEKIKVIDHLSKYMAPGAILMMRSAHGARAFLYPVIDTCDLVGFEVLSVYHPTDEVINSVVIARRCPHEYVPKKSVIDHQQTGIICGANNNSNNIVLPCKCSEIIQGINHGNNMVEELVVDEKLSRIGH